MKRYLICCSVVVLFLLSFSYSYATLLNISLEGCFPDIDFDNAGVAAYDSSADDSIWSGGDNVFAITAIDEKILYQEVNPNTTPSGPDTWEWMSGIGFQTNLELKLEVDANGNWESVSNREWDMVEYVVNWEGYDSLNLKGGTHQYTPGTEILRGDVIAFGYGVIGAGSPKFDFLIEIDPKSPLLMHEIWSDDYLTGLVASASDITGVTEIDWSSDFEYTKMKGDKAPLIPEPGTLLLLGSGLAGMAGYARLRLKRKKNS